MKNKKNSDDKRVDGQRRYECSISECGERGRLLANLGSIQITYCPKHRSYGERVINFLIDSTYRFKLTNFLQENKKELFMDNIPKLSDESYDTLGSYARTMVEKLEELEERYGQKLLFTKESDIGTPDDQEY